MNNDFLRNYAKLIVSRGVNLAKNQFVIVACSVDDAYFGRIIADVAYENGAAEVVFRWNDDYILRQKYLFADDSVFDECPTWSSEFYNYYDRKDPVYISIDSSDPEKLLGVKVDSISRLSKANRIANKAHSELTMNSTIRWCIAAVPSIKWAKKVFPELSDREAFDKLWEAIAICSRINCDDPIEAWRIHNDSFAKRLKYLNNNNFKSLHFKNSLGTDFTMELPENHIWMGGGELDKRGIMFYPNIPTEEIFTLPHKNGVNGKIVSSMPLIYQGNSIEGLELEFKNGSIVSYKADKNESFLKSIIETDEGSHYLGEVALVPFDSPISKINLLFYNTLFDENASCHLAFGKAYNSCLQGSDEMTKEQLSASGVNDSLTHVDFMIGTNDLSITATAKSGETVKLFEYGNYVI